MKPIASPLNIIDFAIMDFEYKFIPPQSTIEYDFKRDFNEYELDIDFSIHTDEVIHVFVKAEINRGKKILPGYSIFAEIACVFEFNKEIIIPTEAKASIEGFSTIYIALNSLRGFINQVTATGPIGRYILPSVDLNDLIKRKQEIVTKPVETKKKVKNGKRTKVKK